MLFRLHITCTMCVNYDIVIIQDITQFLLCYGGLRILKKFSLKILGLYTVLVCTDNVFRSLGVISSSKGTTYGDSCFGRLNLEPNWGVRCSSHTSSSPVSSANLVTLVQASHASMQIFSCLCNICAGQHDESTVVIRHHAVACVTQWNIASSVVTLGVKFVRVDNCVRMFNSEVLHRTSDPQIWMTVANILKLRVLYLIWLKFS
jgi:hypothetical protein